MIRSYGWHRFWQWVHERLALFAKGRFDVHWMRGEEHREAAEKIRPPLRQDEPREWDPRRWERGQDGRSQAEERRP